VPALEEGVPPPLVGIGVGAGEVVRAALEAVRARFNCGLEAACGRGGRAAGSCEPPSFVSAIDAVRNHGYLNPLPWRDRSGIPCQRSVATTTNN
jgi:hypothetical protein